MPKNKENNMDLIFTKEFDQTLGFPQVVLHSDNWNDYSFITMFHLDIYDEDGIKHEGDSVKIGFVGQTKSQSTRSILPDSFSLLDESYFSVGQDPDYYKNKINILSTKLSKAILKGLQDVAFDEKALENAMDESVFKTSLLRGSGSMSLIKGQYKRIINGEAPLTEFNFTYKKDADEQTTEVNLDFKVIPNSKPPTNTHILIGRNGVGKTTLLNNMIDSIIDNNNEINTGSFYDKQHPFQPQEITNEYFGSITSLAFSAFDPFTPRPNQTDSNQGICYYYIGLKNNNDDGKLKDREKLCEEFVESLKFCFSIQSKKKLWLESIKKLESDLNFKEMGLPKLAELTDQQELESKASHLFNTKMSSGHAIILLSISKLVETVGEKTLVLIDEPESHLHPPLLSAFTRALSNLLLNRNAVAIIATHSPVVLQEVPKSCVWKLRRTRLAWNENRPESETFGENVGVLTREVFGLEVSDSGFHELLKKSVSEGGTYEEILESYGNQLGFEGRAILKALTMGREIESDDRS